MSDSKNSNQNEELPVGWASAFSDDWGEIYYYNIHTRETTWIKPEIKKTEPAEQKRRDEGTVPSSSDAQHKQAESDQSDQKKDAPSSDKKYIAELE